MYGFKDAIDRNVNKKGHLCICSHDTVELAEEYGTPVFIFNEDKIRNNFRTIKSAFKRFYSNTDVCFAYKSNSLLAIAKILDQEGAYADVVSGGELYKAQMVGVDPKKIVFNGNNKLRKELRRAIQLGVTINVDSVDELKMIQHETGILRKDANICFRVNPDVSAGVIDEFATGIKKSKFGLNVSGGEAFEAYRKAKETPFCNIVGIHTHIGSQIENSQSYAVATEIIMDLCGKLKKDLNLELKIVNMGGGFAIPFDFLENCSTVEDFAGAITSVVIKKVDEYDLTPPKLLIEPGGSIIGNTATALFKVGTMKPKRGKTLVALDGGADALLRATQGWYTYRVVCANKMMKEPIELVDFVGPICYEGDVAARERKIPKLEEGDIIAFFDVGAYTVVLFNHYNSRPSPAVILVNANGDKEVIRQKEDYKDLTIHENVPERLNFD